MVAWMVFQVVNESWPNDTSIIPALGTGKWKNASMRLTGLKIEFDDLVVALYSIFGGHNRWQSEWQWNKCVNNIKHNSENICCICIDLVLYWFSWNLGVRKRCHFLLHLRQPWFKGLTLLNMNLICKGQTQRVSQWFGMVPCLTVYSMVLMDLFGEIHICWRCKQMLLVFPPESSFANLFLVPFYYFKTSKSDRKKS